MSNYPLLTAIEEQNAPWNQKDPETTKTTVIVTYSVSKEYEIDLEDDRDYSTSEILNELQLGYPDDIVLNCRHDWYVDDVAIEYG